MYDPEKVALANEYLACALDIGERMLIWGAEIHRVEDTIERIGLAYGADRVDVFSITYTIVVTMSGEDFGVLTQTRRISGFSYDLNMMEKLNDLSRSICEKKLKPKEIQRRMAAISGLPAYTHWQLGLAYALISAAFAIFFGGTALDAVVAGGIGIVIKIVEYALNRLDVNRFVVICLCAAAAGFLAISSARLGIGISAEKVSIGNIMVLIPGLMFTNSIRDMFMDNMISGAVRCTEAIIIALAIAFGFALINFTFGG